MPTPFESMLMDADDRPWAAYAACREVDADLFFSTNDAEVGEALRICSGCPVKVECREWALETRMPFGVWGGLTERERKRILRRSA